MLAILASGHVRAMSAKPTALIDISSVKRLLEKPETESDLAEIKLTIDRMIDPSVEVDRTLAQLDVMGKALLSLLPNDAPSRLKLDALRYHLHQPSPWNNNQPFQYDLADPFGRVIRNKLLITYLATRKGNCVSMPLLFVILGEKLGIDVTIAQAPNHLFVKYREADGTYYNIETTSGAGFTRDVWMRKSFPAMSDEGIAQGTYMRPLSKRETAAIAAGTLIEYLYENSQYDQCIELSKVLRQYNPKDVTPVLYEHQATLATIDRDYRNKYPRYQLIPVANRPRLLQLEEQVEAASKQAVAMGWRPSMPITQEQFDMLDPNPRRR